MGRCQKLGIILENKVFFENTSIFIPQFFSHFSASKDLTFNVKQTGLTELKMIFDLK